MMRINPILLLAVALNATGLISPWTGLHAQEAAHPASARRPTRVPVALALVDSLPGGTSFQIVRRANVSPRDVIVFRAGADSIALSDAVEQLLLMRRLQGDTAGTTAMVRVRRPKPAGHRPRVLPWARRVMDDLHRAERKEIPGVGSARTVQIWLPPQRARRAR